MIRPVRYAALAFVILGILGIGAAVDWSSPSRAPFPAIQLHPAPAAEVEVSPTLIQKAKHGGRATARSPRISVRRDSSPADNRNVVSGPTSTDSEVADAPASGQAPAATGSDDDGDSSPGGGNPPSTPNPPNTPAPPPAPDDDDEEEDSGAGGATAAPAPPPEPAGDPEDDDGGEGDDDSSGSDDEDDDDDGGEDG